MIYVINNKAYILVSNYYKEVMVSLIKGEYNLKVIKDSSRIYKKDISEKSVKTMTIDEYYKSKSNISDIIKK